MLSRIFGVTGAVTMLLAPFQYRHPTSMSMAGVVGVILIVAAFVALAQND